MVVEVAITIIVRPKTFSYYTLVRKTQDMKLRYMVSVIVTKQIYFTE